MIKMESKYREIEFGFGKLEDAVNELKSHKDLVCGVFNGKTLYSDVDDMDSAYIKVTGKTRAEVEEAEKQRQAEYERKNQEHEASIPRLTKEWIEKGNAILDSKYQKLWAECVPIRLGDLYQGMELGCTLDIVEKLNSDCEVKEAVDIIVKQGHSGMSYGLVCAMVKSFSDRGAEFVSHART